MGRRVALGENLRGRGYLVSGFELVPNDVREAFLYVFILLFLVYLCVFTSVFRVRSLTAVRKWLLFFGLKCVKNHGICTHFSFYFGCFGMALKGSVSLNFRE